MSYASRTFALTNADSAWSTDFRRLLANTNIVSHRLTSLLCMLSHSIQQGRPLPPYLELPGPVEYLPQIEAIDRDILSIRHIAEPEYSAFAVIHICTECISDDIMEITA